jgi:hypothetical protein
MKLMLNMLGLAVLNLLVLAMIGAGFLLLAAEKKAWADSAETPIQIIAK